MAFDSAGAAGSAAGGTSDTLSWLVQRVRSVQGACDAIQAAAQAVGSPADTPALRGRLGGLFAAGQRLMDEIEPVLLKHRAELLRREQAFRRLEEDYGAVKGRLLEAVRAAQARCRDVKPRAAAAGVPEADARGALKRRAAVGDFAGAGSGGAVQVVNQLQQATGVDVVIAQVRARGSGGGGGGGRCGRAGRAPWPAARTSYRPASLAQRFCTPRCAGECAGGAGNSAGGGKNSEQHEGPQLAG